MFSLAAGNCLALAFCIYPHAMCLSVLIGSCFNLGDDTVATGTSAAFFYLAHNPEFYRTLAREIRTTFDSYEDIKAGPRPPGCTYLRACIEEALRLCRPVSTTLWRQKGFRGPQTAGSLWSCHPSWYFDWGQHICSPS